MGILNNADKATQERLTWDYLRAPPGGEDAVLGVKVAPPPNSFAAAQAAAPDAAQSVMVPRAVRSATGPEVPADVLGALPQSAQERLGTMSENVRAALGGNGGWVRLYELAQSNPRVAEQLVYELNRHGADDVPATLSIAKFASSHPELKIGLGNWAEDAIPEFVQSGMKSGIAARALLDELTPIVHEMTATGRSQFYRHMLSAAPRGTAGDDFRNALNSWWPNARSG
jgi:hypothetical protein